MVTSQQLQQENRLHELGDFLRTRRYRRTPEEFGLPRGTRRKTPGLRRAEVAQLVGVSVDWYTWLEQGRPITPSTQVLERLVQTLGLSANERNHLFLLAQQQPAPTVLLEPERVSPALQNFLDHFGSRPAFVSNRRWDIIAWNDAGCAVFSDYSVLSGRERNTIWGIFTNPLSKKFIEGWEDDARRLLAQFRSSYGRYLGDARFTELVNDLLEASPEFRAWWPDHEVMGSPDGRKVLNFPQVGRLVFERLTFQTFDTPDLKVTVYTPVEETDTPRKVEKLLRQWYQDKGQLAPIPKTPDFAANLAQARPVHKDNNESVGLWLADCGKKEAGEWTANSEVMASYSNWCERHGRNPKKAKGLAQALGALGFEVGVRQWVREGTLRTKSRGVCGLTVQNCTSKKSGRPLGTD